MIPFDSLCAAWRSERARRLARATLAPRLIEDGLVLGPMTVIAKRITNRWGEPTLAIDGNEARIRALLAVAYWRPVGPEAIDALRRASKALSGRNPALAPILIAQAGLGRIEADERAAFRLFCAERLLDAGVPPHELVKGLGLAKYSPDQPRVPGGNPDGGQWTSGGGGLSTTAPGAGADQKQQSIQVADGGQIMPDVPNQRNGGASGISGPRSNNRLTAETFDPAKWSEVKRVDTDQPTVVLSAGMKIAIVASSDAVPPTHQFRFTVQAVPLDANGQPQASIAAPQWFLPQEYSSGLVGTGVKQSYIVEATADAPSQKWIISIPPQEDAHGNFSYTELKVYVRK